MKLQNSLSAVAVAFAAILTCAPAGLAQSGALDPSFQIGEGANGQVNAVAVQGDSKIIIAGAFTAFNNAAANNVARLNVDGSLDASFSAGSGAVGTVVYINAATLQSDGKVIIGGYFNSFNGAFVSNIVRLNTDGSVDTSFNVGAGASATVNRVAVDSSDRIYVAGAFQQFNGATFAGLCRLNPDGSLDTTFSYPLRSGVIDGINTILPQADGTIYIGGSLFNVTNKSVQRLNADGSPNNSLAYNGNIDNGASAIGVQSDGKVIVAFNDDPDPYAGQAVGNVLRLNADGSLDTAFLTGSVPDGPGRGTETLLIQPDDKILLGGFFDPAFYPAIYPGIARLNGDGSVDQSFDPGAGASSDVYSIALDPSNRVVIGGQFNDVDNSFTPGVARLLNSAASSGITLSIAPGVGSVDENSGSPATFVVTASSAPDSNLTFTYSIKGTGQAGLDYAPLKGSGKIKAGKTSKQIQVFPYDRGLTSGKATVKLTLQPGAGYAVGTGSSAKVKIFDND